MLSGRVSQADAFHPELPAMLRRQQSLLLALWISLVRCSSINVDDDRDVDVLYRSNHYFTMYVIQQSVIFSEWFNL